MAITKLNLVNINFDRRSHNELLVNLLNYNEIHLEPASKFTANVKSLAAWNDENIYEDLLNKIESAAKKYKFDLVEQSHISNRINMITAKHYVENFINEVDKYGAVIEKLERLVKENGEAVIHIRNVVEMDVNFDELFTTKYLQIRFGKLPTKNLAKLRFYEGMPFFIRQFHEVEDFTWCMYVTTPNDAPEIDNMFSSLLFERVHIPAFAHGDPKRAIEEIQEETNLSQKNIFKYQNRIQKLYQNNFEEINRIYTVVKHLNAIFIMQRYVYVVGDHLAITGFVEKSKSEEFKANFERFENVHVSLRPADSDVRLVPPTKLTENWFSKPFRIFVEMYGVPSYRDIDPTSYLALSYSLLFGIMFADVGQGLLIGIIASLIYRKTKNALAGIGMRVALVSIFFGVIFGSVFGSEEILTPIFLPMESANTMTLLGFSVGLGIALIVVSMSIAIITNLRRKKYVEMVLSQNCISGLVFYVSVLLLALGMFGVDLGIKPVLTVLAIVTFFLMFFKEIIERKIEGHKLFPEGVAMGLTEAFFELFEIMLTFLANTMSFLRVGGFVLSHAGMMLVVYTIAEMFGGIGYYLVLIFGNLFVMGLEGLIVGIQVLRLEFYEMFSRYYDGDGMPFKNIVNK
ncbi:MAG: V-type ATPase 116kDa subunit family protein [Erysipelotrichaceae bacterium]|nr:V-type ATPase 116kDa subunit family protein [Erysipelotrichaceae bacterium]MDD3809406.1 V-type ATPase 116kDa subunit family protein [Erysipelotrichaceae bacterium]